MFSGVQPTGRLHLGNYLGAIQNWVELQKKFKCIFCIVDLHAITVPNNRKDLKKNSLEVAAAYIASGIDPKKNIIFCQSGVSGHSELSWILSCFAPMGWLNRMTQFKDKAGKNKEKAPLGLYSYPVLMAADILLYQSTHVPVGEDQKQHLELCRDIAQAFNRSNNINFFPIPEPVIMGSATRVMSLKNGLNKMSKSDPSDLSRINLLDSAELIKKKIQKSKTDSGSFPENDQHLSGRPEVENLINIFCSFSKENRQYVYSKYSGKTFSEFKNDLAEILSDKFSIISKKAKELINDTNYLENVLEEGTIRANEIAKKNIKEIKKIMGFK